MIQGMFTYGYLSRSVELDVFYKAVFIPREHKDFRSIMSIMSIIYLRCSTEEVQTLLNASIVVTTSLKSYLQWLVVA